MASLYLHIPFCERKCLYCDFYSLEGSGMMDRYLAALEAEITLAGPLGRELSFDTVYLGGGTPSLLPPGRLGEILGALRAAFRLMPGCEITMEVNPGTVTVEKLRAYGRTGVNRLSIGIQSFNDEELQFLSRIHTSAAAVSCIRDAREAGFSNVSLDLIYALPGQSRERWEQTLSTAVRFAPEHISAYSLIVEEGTPLSRLVRAGHIAPSSPETEADLYEWTMAFLADQGYEQYEVSSFARSGYRSRHNCAYWSHLPVLGFGPSAHSLWRTEEGGGWTRWWNHADLALYLECLETGQVPVAGSEELSRQQRVNERIYLGLRSDGLDLERLLRDLDLDLRRLHGDTLTALVGEGYARVEGSVLRLTSKGYLVCDEIASRLMVP